MFWIKANVTDVAQNFDNFYLYILLKSEYNIFNPSNHSRKSYLIRHDLINDFFFISSIIFLWIGRKPQNVFLD